MHGKYYTSVVSLHSKQGITELGKSLLFKDKATLTSKRMNIIAQFLKPKML